MKRAAAAATLLAIGLFATTVLAQITVTGGGNGPGPAPGGAQVRAANAGDITRLQQQIDTLRSENAALKTGLNNQQAINAAQGADITTLKTQVAALKAK